MAAQTPVYYYNQRQYVVLLEINARATIRYETVYAKELVINKGVDNLLEFAFINQEQKPVNISGKEITCRILNYDGTEVLLQKTLTPTLPVTGITTLQLTAEEIEDIPTQNCYYSLEIPVNTFNYPVFVDAKGGARGVIRIVNSVLPKFVPAKNITIPTHVPPKPGDPKTYYSSEIYTNESPIQTIQAFYAGFTGNVQFQGSTVQDFSTYYDITSPESFSDYTGTLGTTINGYHPFIRAKIVNVGTQPADYNNDLLGDVTNFLSR